MSEIVVTAWLPYALDLIKRFEGCRLHAYPDPATGREPITIGWGHTEPGLKLGTTWSQERCDETLNDDALAFGDRVKAVIHDAPTTATQMAALVSFAYNCKDWETSTLIKKHIAGDYEGARREFGKWINANGHKEPGLVKRRFAEATMYGRAI